MRAASIFLALLTVVALYVAYGQYSRRQGIVAEATALSMTVENLRGKLGKLEALKPKALAPPDESLERLLGRIIDDTDLLGSSVRLELTQQGLNWHPVEHGVTKVTLAIRTQAERQAGLAFFGMVWQILSEQPVRITGATIELHSDIAKFRVVLELFALEGGGR